jgi:hypothetical protein
MTVTIKGCLGIVGALKKLGMSSHPFKAKFPGACALTGLKILVGDTVAYYDGGHKGGPCHMAAISLHVWFPWVIGTLGQELKEDVRKRVEASRKGAK